MIKVLIVEDDPMVAEFNKRYLNEIRGFSLIGISHTVTDAITFLENEQVDLILLDVYMPGSTGLELLSFIREQNMAVDVILITAATDKEKIHTAIRYGAVDYLIKPFEFERFNQALLKYKDKYNFFANKTLFSQEDLDEQFFSIDQKLVEEAMSNLPKGLTSSTLQVVIGVIKSKGNSQFTTDDISETTLISRVSIRKYLKFLTSLGVLEESLTYGIGRPVYLYTLKLDKLNKVNTLL
ncbi:response regulator [Bacillus sp. AFS088145]|uniref:response regulator n=1 Tax=Bacillus sp. AFS088145 TaxID=2033514 RepID=UPI000BF3A9C4|nr:response regulator [Bacillus sp. AFS088145]PFH87005.1 two-component system response regulator DcuR [Bacillus sp. AFS088145]